MSRVDIRTAVFPRDADSVGALVAAYLRQTEAEKAERGLAEETFPARYAREVDYPMSAFSERRVFVAAIEGVDCGLLVSSITPSGTELSRVWTAPTSRGQGVGAALLTAAVQDATRPVRLSVWGWREPALRLYRAAGFEVVPSWDDRSDLVCLELR